MSTEWFDEAAWDQDAQADFRKRLGRSRGQKFYYLGRKASAIGPHDASAALNLCDERLELAADDDETFRAMTQKAVVLALAGSHDEMLIVMDEAIGTDISYHSVLAGEFCCLVGFFGRVDLYCRAQQILETLDAWALREAARPFRSFTARAARALIEYRTGRKSDAAVHAKEALDLALERSATISVLARAPSTGFPSILNDKLLVIANLWNTDELGQPPTV